MSIWAKFDCDCAKMAMSKIINSVCWKRVLVTICLNIFSPHAGVAAEESSNPLSITLGAGAARLADYEGGRAQRAEVFPIVNASLKTDHGLLTLGGDASPPTNNIALLSWAVADPDRFVAAVLIDYDGGRRDDRSRTALHAGSPRLRGLGNLAGTLEYGVFGSYTVGIFVPNLDLRTALGGRGHGGTIVDFSIDIVVPLDEKTSITVSPSSTWASEKYMRSYFGITQAQSTASGFSLYKPAGGLKNIGLTISANHKITKHWLAVVNIAALRLVGNAAGSPIVERTISFSPSAGAAYTW